MIKKTSLIITICSIVILSNIFFILNYNYIRSWILLKSLNVKIIDYGYFEDGDHVHASVEINKKSKVYIVDFICDYNGFYNKPIYVESINGYTTVNITCFRDKNAEKFENLQKVINNGFLLKTGWGSGTRIVLSIHNGFSHIKVYSIPDMINKISIIDSAFCHIPEFPKHVRNFDLSGNENIVTRVKYENKDSIIKIISKNNEHFFISKSCRCK